MQKVTVTSVAIVIVKFIFCMCDCMVDRNVGMSDLSLILGSLHMCGYVHVQSHLSPGMDCAGFLFFYLFYIKSFTQF